MVELTLFKLTLMEYKGLSVQAATEEAVLRKLVERGGEGGVIAIDREVQWFEAFVAPSSPCSLRLPYRPFRLTQVETLREIEKAKVALGL